MTHISLVRVGSVLAAMSFLAAQGPPAAASDDIYTPKGAAEFCQKVSGSLNQKTTASTGVCPAGMAPITCSQLSDNFCKELWSPKNKGNLSLPDGGQILGGTSDKSLLSHAQRLDIEALTDSESRLPDDYRVKAAPILAKIREAMAQPQPTTSWNRKLSTLLSEAQDVGAEVIEARVAEAHPEVKDVRPDDRTEKQKVIYREAELALEDQILKAKYENHPNWKRVADLFPVVKADLLDAISKFKVPEEEKQRMLDKVKGIKLAMPSSDPRIYTGETDCGHTEVNAAYYPPLNVFSICAGYFNEYQDPSAIYFVMAHELSHSIDPVRSSVARFMQTPVGDVVSKLCHAKGPVYSCDEWQKLKDTVFTHVKKITEPTYPLKTLSSCLKTMSKLKPFENALLHQSAFQSSNQSLSQVAGFSGFSYLAQPTTVTKKGAIEPNVYFMRPDLIEAKLGGDVQPVGSCDDLNTMQTFTQILSCQKLDGKKIDFATLAPKDRDPLFAKALAESQDVEAALNEHWYGVCGRDCPDLVDVQMSRNTQEDFADWLGHKALERYIGRQSSAAQMREAIAAGGALFCEPPSPLMLAPDFTRLEKQFNFEVHPDERVRRMSFFTPQIVQQLGCTLDADTKEGTGACEL